MRAVTYSEFKGPLTVGDVPMPEADAGEIILRVKATGICRSDWHGWQGHDDDIQVLPHVPGHEMAGVVHSVGEGVTKWAPGDRVVAPFVAGCGECESCLSGNPQVCPNQSQPGFTHWGSFAEYVRIRYADLNLVSLPPDVDFLTAASLGCRFMTAYRAVVTQGRAAAGEWVAIHGCGGVGLSAVMVARSLGARVVAIDVNPDSLQLAQDLGAEAVLNASSPVREQIREVTGGGPHLSIEAIGNQAVVEASIASLRRRGRHVQVGLLGDQRPPQIPMDRVVAKELEVIGSHGAPASVLALLVKLLTDGVIEPERLVTRRLTLEQGAARLAQMDTSPMHGISVIDRF